MIRNLQATIFPPSVILCAWRDIFGNFEDTKAISSYTIQVLLFHLASSKFIAEFYIEAYGP